MFGYFNLPMRDRHEFGEDVVFIGVPYDGGSRFTGSAAAPEHLRDLSRKVFIGTHRFLMNETNGSLDGFYNHATGQRVLSRKTVVDYGNIALASLRRAIQSRQDSCIPILIGGDHTITYYVLKNFQNSNPISVFYIDAHEDTGKRATKCKNSNVAAWIRSLRNVSDIHQVGLRGYSAKPVSRAVFDTICPSPATGFALSKSTSDRSCYVSIDLDVLEPAFFPSVSVPVVGGIEFRDLIGILYTIFSSYKVLGVDIVEYVPQKDRNGLCGLVVLDLILKILEMYDNRA